jgi:hypothetical protein
MHKPIILNRKELKMNNVYIVKEQIDNTHQTIRSIFSTLEKAESYRKECVMNLFGYLDVNMGHYFPIECWVVDYQEEGLNG